MLLKELISNYIEEHGLSYRAFSKKSGVSSAYLSMINSGCNPSTGKAPVVSYPMLAKIAAGMDISVNQLVQEVDDMPVYIGPEKTETEEESEKLDTISEKAMEVANAYDKISGYGRSLIDAIIAQEKAYKISKKIPVITGAHDSDIYARYNAKQEVKELAEELAKNPE